MGISLIGKWERDRKITQSPSWCSAASPESLLCCSVRVCRQVSSPVSLWSSGQGSATWWSYWRRRWTSPRSCRCSSECAGICRTPCAPGGRRGRERLEIFCAVCVSIKCLDNFTEVPRLLLIFTSTSTPHVITAKHPSAWM